MIGHYFLISINNSNLSPIKSKIKSITLFYILLITAVISACSSNEEKETTFLTNGLSFLNKGDYFMARMQFKQALRIDPDITEAYYNLGQTEVYLGNPKQALSNFLRVLKLNPNHVDAHIHVGQIMLNAGFPQKAIQQANFALAIDETRHEALELKASALIKQKSSPDKIQLANQIFERLLSSGSVSAHIYHQSASALLLQNKITQAQARVEEGLTQTPDSPLLLGLLADIYQRQGKKKDAIGTYQKLITIEPSQPDAVFKLADLLWKENQQTEAQQILAKSILSGGTEDDSTWLRLSQFYHRKNKNDLAFNTLLAGLQTHPQSFELRHALARELVDNKEYFAAIKKLYPVLSDLQAMPEVNMDDTQLLLSKSFSAVGDLIPAEQYINRYLKNHPQNPEAHFVKGSIYLLDNDPHSAASEFWTILSSNPNDKNARLQLAHAMTRMDQWQKATEILSAGITQTPDEVMFRYALFQINLNLNRHGPAEDQLKEILSIKPNDIKTLDMLAELYTSIKNYDKAIGIYSNMIKKHPKRPWPYIRLSRIYTIQKDIYKAIDLLQKGFAVQPDSDALFKAIVEIYIENNRNKYAVTTAQNKLAKAPESSLGYLLLGQAYAASKNYGKAEKAYMDLVNLASDSIEANYQLMEFWYGQNKKDKIVTHYQSLISKKPSGLVPYVILARFYAMEQNYTKAFEFYDTALKVNPEDWQVAIEWMRLLCAAPRSDEDLDAALKLARKMLRYQPENPLVLAALGWAYHCTGDFDHAQGYLYRSLNLTPDLPVALLDLAKVSLEAGRDRIARYALKRVMALDEDFAEKNDVQKMLNDLIGKKRFSS